LWTRAIVVGDQPNDPLYIADALNKLRSDLFNIGPFANLGALIEVFEVGAKAFQEFFGGLWTHRGKLIVPWFLIW